MVSIFTYYYNTLLDARSRSEYYNPRPAKRRPPID